jgi:DNA-binding transcriptional LysR family regulator
MSMKNAEFLKLFLEVARRGSFVEAARHLNETTTTVSRKIRQLEAELGVLLLHRTTRSLALTEMGERLVPKAEAAIASIQELTDEVDQHAHVPTGTLNISAPATIFQDLAPLLAKFARQYPDIDFRFHSSGRYKDLVKSRLDFAFRIGPLSDSSIIARPIASVDYCLVARPECLIGRVMPRHPAELEDWPCIRTHIDDFIGPWNFSRNGETYNLESDGHILSDDLTFCIQMTLEGLGLALLPRKLVQPYLEDRTLIPLLEDWMPASRELYLVYQAKSYLPPKSRALIDFLTGNAPSLIDTKCRH